MRSVLLLLAICLLSAQPALGQDAGTPPAARRALAAALPGVEAGRVVATEGGRLLYHDRPPADGLWLYDVSSQRASRILAGAVADFASSPAGDRLAFVQGDGGGGEAGLIWRLPLDPATGLPAGPAQPLSRSIGSEPSFSPDGAWIAFIAADGLPERRLVVIPAQGGPERVLVSGTDVGLPRWSADGRWISFRAAEIRQSSNAGGVVLRVAFAGPAR